MCVKGGRRVEQISTDNPPVALLLVEMVKPVMVQAVDGQKVSEMKL